MIFTFRRAALVTILLTQAPLSNTHTAERRLVRRGIAFMGGEAALRAVRTRQTVSTEVFASIGQEELPGFPIPGPALTQTTTWDYGRHLVQRRQVPAGTDPTRALPFVLQDDRGGILVRDTVRTIGGAGALRAAESMRRQARLAPERLLLAALDAPESALRAAGRTRILGEDALGVEIRLALDTVTLWFDVSDGRPLAMDTRRSDELFGTRLDRETYTGWGLYNGLRMPSAVELTQNGMPARIASVVSIEINSPRVDSLADVPANVRMTPAPAPPTKLVDLAPDVVRVEGSDGNVGYGGGVPYYSIAVRQGDSILVFETPLGSARAIEVLDSLRSRFPGTRATSLIVTHAHYDHLGGLPAATDRGLRVIAARELIPFIRGLAGARKRSFTAVDDSLIVGAGDSRFVLYRVPTVHARGMLLAWFPAHRLIVESDLAGLATPMQQRELATWVAAKGLAVERLAGTHGPIGTWTDFISKLK